MSNAEPTKVTLAELASEMRRVGFSLTDSGHGVNSDGDYCVDMEDITIKGGSEQSVRRRVLRLLRALPDGAMK